MFLEYAKKSLDLSSPVVSPSVICWDMEDAYNYDNDTQMRPEEFTWYKTDFDLSNLGDAAFLKHMISFIEREMDFENLNGEEDWEEIWDELEKGRDIHSPVHIALAYQPHYDHERVFIADGWHRIGMYLRAGRKTIPAFVGLPKPLSDFSMRGEALKHQHFILQVFNVPPHIKEADLSIEFEQMDSFELMDVAKEKGVNVANLTLVTSAPIERDDLFNQLKVSSKVHNVGKENLKLAPW